MHGAINGKPMVLKEGIFLSKTMKFRAKSFGGKIAFVFISIVDDDPIRPILLFPILIADTQCTTCHCGEGDKCIWNPNSSENSDKQPQSCPNCQILKSGYLFISSKGIGWTSWKKRWFILTRKSLVFYRFDPNTHKGNEANPTLGGIDLINSGSVVVKADKKLLTVNFPDGQDGRNFTLKGDTSDELQEWKIALEGALAQAPSASLDKAKSGIFLNETVDTGDAALEQLQDKEDVNLLVIGRPVELALQDIDGSPSFLEKALRFIEEHGIKVEGILRQSADVEEVERREKEFEQGKSEFSADEDAHIIGDCIKHVLRELPSSPVPASCCTALVEAYKTERGKRIKAIRGAIAETLPEPNLRLLQRILKMMLTVASHRAENRMSLSALAACMAPLLLRPLLAGDCEFEDNFNMDGDGSVQLLKAAAAANHAQAIVIIMLEEYGRIFDEGNSQDDSSSSDMHSGSEELDDDVEHSSDGSFSDNGTRSFGSRSFSDNGSRSFSSTRSGSGSRSFSSSRSGSSSRSRSRSRSRSCSRSVSGSRSYSGSDASIHEEEDHIPYSSSREYTDNSEVIESPTSKSDAVNLVKDNNQEPKSKDTTSTKETNTSTIDDRQDEYSHSSVSPTKHVPVERISTSGLMKSASHNITGSPVKYKNKSNRGTSSMRRPTKWRRTSAKKILPLEPTDLAEEEIAIQELEATKSDLEHKIAKEVKANENLRESIQKRKEDLLEHRSALQKDVELLREQLQKERDLRLSLESGLMNMRPGHAAITCNMDSKTREDLQEINQVETDIISLKQKASNLRGQISTPQQKNPQNEKDASRTSDNSIPHEDKNSIKSDIRSSPVKDVMRESHKVSSSSNKNQESEVASTLKSGENPKHEAGHSNSSTNQKPSAIDSNAKKLNSKGLSIPNIATNTKFEINNDSAYLKAHKLHSPTFGDLKSSHKLPRQPTNPSKSKLNDIYPLYIDEPITSTRNSASKKSMSSSKSDERFPASSSAITRLIPRLNFLKGGPK